MRSLIPFNRRGSGLTSFQSMMDDFFNDDFWVQRSSFPTNTFKLDIREDQDKYVVEAEMPGIEKEEIDLEIHDNQLNIKVKKEMISDEEKEDYVHKERRLQSMERSIYLADADPKNVQASLDKGVLTVTVSKLDKGKNIKRIEIK